MFFYVNPYATLHYLGSSVPGKTDPRTIAAAEYLPGKRDNSSRSMAFRPASISAGISIFSAPAGLCHGAEPSRVTLKGENWLAPGRDQPHTDPAYVCVLLDESLFPNITGFLKNIKKEKKKTKKKGSQLGSTQNPHLFFRRMT